MVYLASPYSDPDPAVRERRFQQACAASANLMRRGILLFSPIAHTHPIALYGLPKGWEFWEQYDREFLAACERMIVLTLPGWRHSVGVKAEILTMQAMGKPVEYMRLVNGRCRKHSPPMAKEGD